MATVAPATRPRAEVEQDIRHTLGIVPSFFKRIPDRFLADEWELFKDLELGETLIAAARWAAEGREGELDPGAMEELRRVVAGYDRAAREIQPAE